MRHRHTVLNTALIVILAVELVAVHAIIEHALKAGQEALDTLHEIQGRSA